MNSSERTTIVGGGLHLVGLEAEALSATVQNLVGCGADLCIGHCTGEVAFSALLQEALEKMIYAGAGDSTRLGLLNDQPH